MKIEVSHIEYLTILRESPTFKAKFNGAIPAELALELAVKAMVVSGDYHTRKINHIKAARELMRDLGLPFGLKEAKDLVERIAYQQGVGSNPQAPF